MFRGPGNRKELDIGDKESLLKDKLLMTIKCHRIELPLRPDNMGWNVIKNKMSGSRGCKIVPICHPHEISNGMPLHPHKISNGKALTPP